MDEAGLSSGDEDPVLDEQVEESKAFTDDEDYGDDVAVLTRRWNEARRTLFRN